MVPHWALEPAEPLEPAQSVRGEAAFADRSAHQKPEATKTSRRTLASVDRPQDLWQAFEKSYLPEVACDGRRPCPRTRASCSAELSRLGSGQAYYPETPEGHPLVPLYSVQRYLGPRLTV